MKRMMLCKPGPSCCPEVIVHDDKHVEIKDKGQKINLTPGQWDILRMKIKKGEL